MKLEEIVRQVKALSFNKDSVLAEHSTAFSDWDAMHDMGFGQDDLPERSHTIRGCMLFRDLFGENKKGLIKLGNLYLTFSPKRRN